ncbi:MAG: zinc-ribbon domain containing protein [Bacteroidia bacterium]|nr:zinc-ribbon domain containing protein [Bacteroidia bacterium]
MRKKKGKIKHLKCPSCKAEISAKAAKACLEKDIPYGNIFYRISGPSLQNHKRPIWACDECLQVGKAIIADISKQVYLDYDPYVAYVDRSKICKTCGDHFVFSKTEQKFWYEDLQFWVQVQPNNCLPCRKEIRHQKNLNSELSFLLKEKDDWILAELERIVEIYIELEKFEKAKFYQSKIDKVERRKRK